MTIQLEKNGNVSVGKCLYFAFPLFFSSTSGNKEYKVRNKRDINIDKRINGNKALKHSNTIT